ncbi:MAG: Cation efflux system protein CusC [Chlamydiales bacterium]|nr:Cation efflux system protein CusC [Chlamydiales bacterium]
MRRFVILCSLIFCATACKVGPDFSPPCVLVEEEFLSCKNAHITCDEPFCLDWWSYFEDEILDCLIFMAESQNLTLKTAGMRILEARAQLGIAVGEFFPQLQEAVGSAQKVKISKHRPNTFPGTDFEYWDFISGLQAAWELDFWGRFRRGIESTEEGYLASLANYQDVLVLLLSDVATNYVLVRTFEERIEIIKKNIALQERSLEIVEARFEAGAVTELDVQQAKTFVFDTRSRLPVLENELQQTKNALAVLLGLTPELIECTLTEPGIIPIAPLTIAVGIPAELLSRRPDVRRALHLTASQSANIGVAVSDLLPRISITGFIGFQTVGGRPNFANRGGRLFENKSLTYMFGPDIAWPILNYGRLTNQVRVEYALFYQRVLDYQNTVLIAYKEVEDGLSAFLRAHDEVDELDISVKSADRATELARTQYVEGIADYLRVLDSERSKLEVDERLKIARGKIALGLIATYRALGGGWEPFACIESQ